ncbi:MAG: pyridoxamine 5'-phosphate oxidase [Bdellovibrionota bacterium]
MERNDLSPDPLEQFEAWLADAQAKSDLEFPHATALATAAKNGRPSVRMVLLKGVNKTGFSFFTNFESRKARELTESPFAALCFFWEPLGRQVRVEGRVERVSDADSDAYFRTRPRGSKLGAWASPQSREIESRKILEDAVQAAGEKYPGEVPRPPHWGGFMLVPDRIEFWKNGEDRLHDRFEYSRDGSGPWTLKRLAP